MTVATAIDEDGLPRPGTGTAADADGRMPPAARAKATGQRRWRSAELFGLAQEVEIEHGQAVYRLRRTSLGKLILTK